MVHNTFTMSINPNDLEDRLSRLEEDSQWMFPRLVIAWWVSVAVAFVWIGYMLGAVTFWLIGGT